MEYHQMRFLRNSYRRLNYKSCISENKRLLVTLVHRRIHLYSVLVFVRVKNDL